MFKTILVPLDGSARAEQAIPIAGRIARATDGTVILLEVAAIPIDVHAEEKRPAEIYAPEVIDAGLKQAQVYLSSLTHMPELVSVKTQVKAIIGGIAPSILDAIEPLGVDLIVMWSHGYTGFKHWELGSIAHKIVHHSPVPVLLLRDDGPTLRDQSIRALVPLDGSPLSETVLPPVVAFMTAAAPANQRFLHLIRVVDLPVASGKFRVETPFDQEVTQDMKREAHQYLAAHAAQLMEGDYASYELGVTTSVAVNTDVAGALVEQAEQAVAPFDLIAMATHGRGGVPRWFMGSVMERVLHHTKLPLLVVPAAAHQKHAEERKETVGTTR